IYSVKKFSFTPDKITGILLNVEIIIGGGNLMSVKIRLKRMGSKKRPFYRIVVADSRSPRDGRFIETVGTYNPLTDPETVTLKEEKVMNWLNNGAQPSDTVRNILSRNGVMKKFHEAKFSKKYGKEMTEIDVKQLILTIVLPLVAEPDDVKIETEQDDYFLNFNLSVSKEDVGRVIGKHGRIAQAIRNIVYGIRLDNNLNVRLNIVD